MFLPRTGACHKTGGPGVQNHLQTRMMSMGASRLIAAPFARGTIANLGRNGYGALQLRDSLRNRFV